MALTENPHMNLNLALSELRLRAAMYEHNAPLHDLAGEMKQAELCREVARQCRAAIALLKPDILPSGVAQYK